MTSSFPLPLRTPLNRISISSFGIVWHELEHIAVDAVTLVGRRRPIVKNMSQMDAGTGAPHLDSPHAVCDIDMLGDRPLDRIEEAWPASAAVELCVASKQRRAGDRVDKCARTFFIEMRAGEGAFGAAFKRNFLLFGRQQLGSPAISRSATGRRCNR